MAAKPKVAFVLANGWGIKGFVHTRILERLSAEFELAAWAQPYALKSWNELIAVGEAPATQLFPMPPESERFVERLVRQTQSSLFFARNKIETEAIKNQGSRKPWQPCYARRPCIMVNRRGTATTKMAAFMRIVMPAMPISTRRTMAQAPMGMPTILCAASL
jgi:hypothetical protein